MKKILSFFGLTTLLLFQVTSCNSNDFTYDTLGERPNERTLNFYALNDFHGAFLYDEDYEQTGLSRIGNYLINQKENDPENTFIISSGDMFQGGAESNITYGEVIIEAMNAIDFDSMTIGNHEFDWGVERLEIMADQMDFPFLGINIFNKDDNSRPSFLSPSTVVEREGIRVGIIGSIMPGIEDDILATISNQFLYDQSLDLIKEEATRLREIEHCEVVVLSTHDGNESYYETLANDDYIDALFLGHDHRYKEGTFNDEDNTPYVEGGNYGSYVSHISLNLKLVNGNYEVIHSSVENIETFGNSSFNEESSLVNAVYDEFKDEIESIRDEVLYVFPNSLSRSKFGNYLVEALLNYTNNVLTKEDEYKDIYVTKALMNSGGIRDSISAGEFTYGDLLRVYPFENVLCILKVDPSDYDFVPNPGYMYEIDSSNNYNGSKYIATIDYVAYQSSYSMLSEEIIPTLVTARDIVANELKTNGYYES